jgi:hypothetical protein
MQIYTVQMSSENDGKAFVEFVSLLGLTSREDGYWDNKWSNLGFAQGHPFETVVDCDRKSPYNFAKKLRAAVSAPEPRSIPYPSVNSLNGVYYCNGDDGLFSFAVSSAIGADQAAADLLRIATPVKTL